MKNYILITAVSFLATACNKNNDTKIPEVSFKNIYEVNNSGLYPEGIDYDTKNERFIFGSMHKGIVYAMDTEGKLTTFATNNKLVSVSGVYTDETRNRLIIANGDLGISQKSASSASAGSVATVEVYNLTTGALLQQIDLKKFNTRCWIISK